VTMTAAVGSLALGHMDSSQQHLHCNVRWGMQATAMASSTPSCGHRVLVLSNQTPPSTTRCAAEDDLAQLHSAAAY